MGEERRNRRRLLAVGVVAVGALAVGALALAAWWFSPGRQQRWRAAALIEAARSGDARAVEAALDGGAEVNARDADGITRPRTTSRDGGQEG